MNTLLEQRIVELTFTPIPELPNKLKRLGIESELYDKDTSIMIHGQIRVGFSEADPISKAVQLGFAICGARWASLVPGLLDAVKKEWRARRKS